MSAASEGGVRQWAQRYAELGWAPFPLPRNAKVPEKGSHGFHDATTDPVHLDRWWPPGSTRAAGNIGLAVPRGADGEGDLIVVDVDSSEAMQALKALDYYLPTTAEARTPRGGWHFLYRLPEGVRGRQTESELLDGVDTRAAGKGYICAEPSRVNGAGYRWVTPPLPENIADAPPWVIDKLTEREGDRPRLAPPVEEEILPKGKRHKPLLSLAGTMRRRGMTVDEILAALLEVNRRRCQPPLEDRWVERIAESVCVHKPAESVASAPPALNAEHDGAPGTLEDALEELARAEGASDAEHALRILAARLTCADGLTRQTVRERAIASLRKKVSSPAGMVDAALGGAPRSAEDGKQQGRALELPEPEPWGDPVEGRELADALASYFARHLALPQFGAEILALWALFAHALEAFEVAAILAITSPTKRCGKTRTLELLSALVPRPLPASNLSAAALFRTVEAARPTLLLDEAETFIGPEKEELRGILNSGHTRPFAYVVRVVGDRHEVRKFTTWAAKAVALIGHLPDTLADRSVELRLRRRSRGEQIERLTPATWAEAKVLARKCARLAADNADALRAATPDAPEMLDDRARDNWSPLLAIADCIGGDWPARARNAAASLAAEAAEDEDALAIQLLRDIRTRFDAGGIEAIASSELVEALRAIPESPWADFWRGKGLTVHRLGRMLGEFGIHAKRWRSGDARIRGYEREQLEDAWGRYTPLQSGPPGHANSDGHSREFQSGPSPSVGPLLNPGIVNSDGQCPGGPLSDPPTGEPEGVDAPEDARERSAREAEAWQKAHPGRRKGVLL